MLTDWGTPSSFSIYHILMSGEILNVVNWFNTNQLLIFNRLLEKYVEIEYFE